jgi:hypothetical protein
MVGVVIVGVVIVGVVGVVVVGVVVVGVLLGVAGADDDSATTCQVPPKL